MSKKRQEKQAKLAKRIKVVAFKDGDEFRGALYDPAKNGGAEPPYIWTARSTHATTTEALLDARIEYQKRARTTVRKRSLIAP